MHRNLGPSLKGVEKGENVPLGHTETLQSACEHTMENIFPPLICLTCCRVRPEFLLYLQALNFITTGGLQDQVKSLDFMKAEAKRWREKSPSCRTEDSLSSLLIQDPKDHILFCNGVKLVDNIIWISGVQHYIIQYLYTLLRVHQQKPSFHMLPCIWPPLPISPSPHPPSSLVTTNLLSEDQILNEEGWPSPKSNHDDSRL